MYLFIYLITWKNTECTFNAASCSHGFIIDQIIEQLAALNVHSAFFYLFFGIVFLLWNYFSVIINVLRINSYNVFHIIFIYNYIVAFFLSFFLSLLACFWVYIYTVLGPQYLHFFIWLFWVNGVFVVNIYLTLFAVLLLVSCIMFELNPCITHINFCNS